MSATARNTPKPILIPLNYRGSTIRVFSKGHTFWFNLTDLCLALRLPNTTKKTPFVNEAALYTFVSRTLPKERAEHFTRWTTIHITEIRAKAYLENTPHQGCDIADAAQILSRDYDIGSGRLWSILYHRQWIYRHKRNRPLAHHDTVTAGYLLNVPQTRICPSSHAKRAKPKVQITAKGITALAGILDNLGLRKTPTPQATLKNRKKR